jgi:hypothetical protein
MSARHLVVAAGLALCASPLAAQVGYPPHQSPYRDLRETMEVTFYSGYYRAKKDPARVAPVSGPIFGAQYQWRAGGPAHLTVDLARVESERRVLDPEKGGLGASSTPCLLTDVSCKSAGVYRWPLYMLDGGLTMALTGERSFLKMVPLVKAGVGIVSDFHSQPDVGAFAFGTRFALTWGAGLRVVPGGRYSIRADISNRLYTVKYPISYYVPADDGTAIFPSTAQGRTAWLNNPAFTIGVSYLFSR